MSETHDPLENAGEGMPITPGRRRRALAFGILMLLLILVALVWFVVTNTETMEGPSSLFSFIHTGSSRSAA